MARGPLIWMGESKERKILEVCDEHMKRIVKTVASMNEAVQAFCDLDVKKMDKGFNEAFKNEREADVLKRNILEELSKGIFHPINRDEIIRLTMTADEIAANAKAAARKLKYIEARKLPADLKKTMRIYSAAVLDTAIKTHETFISLEKDPKTAIALSHEVEKMEEKIDDLRAEELTPGLLKWYRKIKDIGQSLLMKEITENMESIADLCEDVSDIIRSIAISYS
ncbi:DUF47 domain-containing protein [Candidatus Hadarchaeum sp.]|uniref:DUF47 domain-containing protein n=1 Tax=Candidatus Hadarchaeum sp. TaxID=2883567 RepID=UPI003D0A1636